MKRNRIWKICMLVFGLFVINMTFAKDVQAESVSSDEIRHIPNEKRWSYIAATDNDGNESDSEIILTGYRDWDYENKNYNVLIEDYKDWNGAADTEWEDETSYCLVVPEEIQGKKVVGIDFNAGVIGFSARAKIVSLDIPNTVESICLRECYDLIHLELPSSIKKIDDYAFYEKTYLTEISIPEGVVSIGEYAFYGCSALTEVVLPASLRSLGGDDEEEYTVFADCRSLKKITVATGNTQYYDVNGVLFSDRIRTTYEYIETGELDEDGDEIIISKEINQKFRYIITYPAGKEGKFTMEADMIPIEPHVTFLNAVGLTEIQVDSSNPDYISVDGVLYSKDLKYLYACPAGKTGSLIIPEGVESMESNAFSYSSLSSLQLSDSVKIAGYHQFYNSTKLESISIGKSFEDIRYINLDEIPSLKTVTVSELNENCIVIDNVVYNKEQSEMLVIPGGYNGKLVIPDSVNKIKVNDGVYSISELHIGKGIGFNDFIHPEVTYVDDYDGSLVVEEPYIYDAFISLLKKAKKITVSEENTDFITDNDGVLYSSDMKTLIAFPKNEVKQYTIPDGITTIYTDIFPWCDAYEEGPYLTLTIPNSVSNIFGDGSLSWGTIKGYTGSVAEEYAKKYDVNFVVISNQLGDVYQDGKIDGKDVSLLLQYRLKKRELTEEQIAAGDVYADGKIDGKDVSKLLQYRLGKISSLK